MNKVKNYPPELMMRAHQFLYYVLGREIWSDQDYDFWCKANNLNGGGGSDCASDYSLAEMQLAREMLLKPKDFPCKYKMGEVKKFKYDH